MIFRWKHKTATTPYPFGLTKPQLAQLARLTDTKGYDIFTGLLRDIAELNGSTLLDTHDYGDIRERQGFIRALRHVTELLPMIKQEAQRLDDEQSRAEQSAGNYDDRSFYGTTFWDRIKSWDGKRT